jgi:hypothetical protein
MYRPLRPVIASLALLASPGVAAAQSLGSTASASATITVIIPPIAPVLEARAGGAVGLWSMTGGGQGLMLKLGSQGGGDAALSLYTPDATVLSVRMADGGRVLRAAENRDGGLRRQDFLLAANAATPAHTPMTVVIASP